MMALLGAHRVGKTTLAQEYAKQNGWHFAQTSVSAWIKELGHDPATVHSDFGTRLDVQEHVLEKLSVFLKESQGEKVITDRSPLDLLAWTMTEANGDLVKPEHQERFKKYTDQCFDLANRYFSTLLLVQPGIEVKPDEGKGALNQAFMEHLNTIMMGLVNDPRLKVQHFYIPRDRTDLALRVKSVEFAHKRTLDFAQREADEIDPAMLH